MKERISNLIPKDKGNNIVKITQTGEFLS